jgi:redox-sensitive bicupin YhaK (pirin superfamily)
VASTDGREQSLHLHQDASIHATVLDAGTRVSHTLAPGRHAWIQLVRGEASVDGQVLSAGDGAAVSNEAKIEIEGRTACEFLLFDLA